MKIINLRFYDEDLHKEMKLQAVKEDTTLQSLVMKACREYLDRVKKSNKSTDK